MKKGLPNILPLPNSCQKPRLFFWQCPCFFALFFGKRMQVAYTWTRVEFAWLLAQDGAAGFEFAGNAFKITGQVSDIDDLKEVLCSPFLRFVGSAMIVVQVFPCFFNMCCE